MVVCGAATNNPIALLFLCTQVSSELLDKHRGKPGDFGEASTEISAGSTEKTWVCLGAGITL
jgi:hypothetical protein